jgi:hypothetical protein
MRRRCLILLALLVGCQSVTVHSAPYGADVFVDGERIGKTPCKFKASTVIGSDYVVEVRHAGYRPYVESVETEWGPGTTWNLLSSLVFLSPLIILTPFFGDVVPGAIYAPLELEQTGVVGTPTPVVVPHHDEEAH